MTNRFMSLFAKAVTCFFITLICCSQLFAAPNIEEPEDDYSKRRNQRVTTMIRIQEETRKRCPHVKIGNRVVALCHGEEAWRKKIDRDHQELFQYSEFYHQYRVRPVCEENKIFEEINFRQHKKIKTKKREGIGIWMSLPTLEIELNTPMNLMSIDYTPQKKRADFYSVIVTPEAHKKMICEITHEDIVDVVKFHDPNCDLEIMTETPLIKFVHITEEDIYQIFLKLNSLDTRGAGCVNDLNDLLLLKKRACVLTENHGAISHEYPANKKFLEKIKANSHAGTALDFSSGDRISGDRHTFFVFDGVVYNYRDFGNLLWGLGYRLASCHKKNLCQKDHSKIKCRASFLGKRIALAGANINAFFNTYKENLGNAYGCSVAPVEGEEENTVILRGDSAPDQAAIKRGLTHPVGDYILQKTAPSYCQALRKLGGAQ